jgi:hypothetical protein
MAMQDGMDARGPKPSLSWRAIFTSPHWGEVDGEHSEAGG